MDEATLAMAATGAMGVSIGEWLEEDDVTVTGGTHEACMVAAPSSSASAPPDTEAQGVAASTLLAVSQMPRQSLA